MQITCRHHHLQALYMLSCGISSWLQQRRAAYYFSSSPRAKLRELSPHYAHWYCSKGHAYILVQFRHYRKSILEVALADSLLPLTSVLIIRRRLNLQGVASLPKVGTKWRRWAFDNFDLCNCWWSHLPLVSRHSVTNGIFLHIWTVEILTKIFDEEDHGARSRFRHNRGFILM